MRIPTHLMSAAAALALLAGPALADEQTQAQQGGNPQATTQPAQDQNQSAFDGR